MSGVPVGVGNRCLTAPLLGAAICHPASSLGAHSQPRVQVIGACPGATLWLSPEEESHTRMSIFASLYLQNLNLGDGAGPRGGGGGAIAFTRFQ